MTRPDGSKVALVDLPIGEVTREVCREIVRGARRKGLKRSSVEGVQATLSAALTQAVEDRYLEANPAFRMGKYMRPGDELDDQVEVDPFTREESATFLQVARLLYPRFYVFWLVALRTGCRLGEIIGLQWGDIDHVNGCIHVRRAVVGGQLTTTKTHQRRRVDMSLQLAAALEAWHTACQAEALADGVPLSEWVFTGLRVYRGKGGRVGRPRRRVYESNLRGRVYNRIFQRAGLRRIKIHNLRHTFASLLIQAGHSLAYIQKQMGHSSIQVTVNIYGHLVPGAQRGIVDTLDDVPGTATTHALPQAKVAHLTAGRGAGDVTQTAPASPRLARGKPAKVLNLKRAGGRS